MRHSEIEDAEVGSKCIETGKGIGRLRETHHFITAAGQKLTDEGNDLGLVINNQNLRQGGLHLGHSAGFPNGFLLAAKLNYGRPK
jgi:hypothetical protein